MKSRNFRFVFSHTKIDTVASAQLGRLLRDGAESVWACPCTRMPSREETGNWGAMEDRENRPTS